jgi:hypothetical protein
MDSAELKLECLKLAMLQARIENTHGDRKAVAEISSEFYNHIVSPTESLAADNSPSIFSEPAKGKKK